MLKATAVSGARFSPTKFREGYAVGGVDDFLMRVAATLSTLESGNTTGPRGSALVTPDEVANHRFMTTRVRDGYDVIEVDDFLDAIVDTLSVYIARAQRGEPLVQDSDGTPGPDATDAPGIASPSTSPEKAAAKTSPASTAGSGTGGDQPGSAMATQDFLRDLQYQRALLSGSARESLVFHGSDGREFAPVRIERTPTGIVVHIT